MSEKIFERDDKLQTNKKLFTKKCIPALLTQFKYDLSKHFFIFAGKQL